MATRSGAPQVAAYIGAQSVLQRLNAKAARPRGRGWSRGERRCRVPRNCLQC
jgi:hypothetical protein